MKKLIPLLCLALVGCAHKQIYKDVRAWNEAPEKSVGLQIRSAKFKGKKIDVTYVIHNNYPFMVVVPPGSVGLASNGDSGMTNGNPRIELRPDQDFTHRMLFRFDEKPEGPFKLILGGIYKGEEYTKDVSVSGTSFGARSIGSSLAGGINSASTEYKTRAAVENERLPSVQVEFSKD